MSKRATVHKTLFTARADFPDGTRINETLVLESTMDERLPAPDTTLTIFGPRGKVLGHSTTAKTQTARVY